MKRIYSNEVTINKKEETVIWGWVQNARFGGSSLSI